jgi:hypothetical protein
MLQVQPRPAADHNEGKRQEQHEEDREEDREGDEEGVSLREDVLLPKLCTEEEARPPGQAQVAAKTTAPSPSLRKSR